MLITLLESHNLEIQISLQTYKVTKPPGSERSDFCFATSTGSIFCRVHWHRYRCLASRQGSV